MLGGGEVEDESQTNIESHSESGEDGDSSQ